MGRLILPALLEDSADESVSSNRILLYRAKAARLFSSTESPPFNMLRPPKSFDFMAVLNIDCGLGGGSEKWQAY